MEKLNSPKRESYSEPFEHYSRSSHRINYKINNYNMENPNVCVDVYATQEELGFLEKNGFLLCRNIIDSAAVCLLKEAVDKLVDKEMTNTKREYYPGNGIFIRYLVDKEPLFIRLLKYPPILSVVRAMLGPQVQLMDMVARVSFLDEPEHKLMWHIHNRVIPNPLPPFFAHPHSLDALIYLDETTERNGPLCVIPGSHKDIHMDIGFRDHMDKDGQILITVNAGDCVFSHSNLWHRVLPALEKGPEGARRRVLLLGFMPSWFKRDFPKGIRPTIRLAERVGDNDAELKELLGHFEWI